MIQTGYRLDKDELLGNLRAWNRVLRKKSIWLPVAVQPWPYRESLEPPLEERRNELLVEFSHLSIGILNDYDLISSKLMRGTRVDFEDCVMLAKAHKDTLDLERLTSHFLEMISYDVGEGRLRPNIDHFLELIRNGDHDE